MAILVCKECWLVKLQTIDPVYRQICWCFHIMMFLFHLYTPDIYRLIILNLVALTLSSGVKYSMNNGKLNHFGGIEHPSDLHIFLLCFNLVLETLLWSSITIEPIPRRDISYWVRDNQRSVCQVFYVRLILTLTVRKPSCLCCPNISGQRYHSSIPWYISDAGCPGTGFCCT